jgi:predicted ribosomally synthesized peptide with SipW-like signal peptide
MIEQPTTVTPGPVATQDDTSRRRRRGLFVLLLGLTTISLGAGMFSLAYFTDTTDATGTFEAGTIDISTSPTVAFNVTDMLPGDTDTAAITVTNGGSGTFRYAMTAAATNALGGQLTLTVREEGTDCATFDGTVVLSETTLDGAAFGDPATGPDGGDRELSAPGSEVLCFRVTLPDATDDTYQGATSDATFTFDAEQTANNP